MPEIMTLGAELHPLSGQSIHGPKYREPAQDGSGSDEYQAGS